MGTANLSLLATLDGETSAATETQRQVVTTIWGQQDTKSFEIIEAQGWVKTADGNIALVAQVAEATPSAAITSAMCPVFN